MEELLGRHDAIALEDQTVLHHERHIPQSVDVLQRIGAHGDQVSGQANLDRAALVVISQTR